MIRPAAFFLLAVCASLTAPSSADIALRVTRTDGTRATGVLVAVEPALTLRSGDAAEELALPWADVMQVEQLNLHPPQPDGQADSGLLFLWVDGTQAGGVLEGAPGELRVRTGQQLELPLAPRSLRAVRRALLDAELQQTFTSLLEDATSPDDVAVVARGERRITLRGTLQRLDAAGVVMRWNERDVTVPLDRLAALVLRDRAAVETEHRLTLLDGTVLAGRLSGGDARLLQLRRTSGSLEIPWQAVRRIDCQSGNVAYLDALPVADYRYEPLYGPAWSYTTNQTFSGAAIQIGGARFARGVCLRSRATLSFDLGGRFSQFATTIGVLDEMEQRGDARVEIRGDDRVLWSAPSLRGGQAGQQVLVDVQRVRTLTLIVDFGNNLDFSDQVGLGDARVLR